MITLNEAKKYLRVDYDDDDTLIHKFIKTGTKLVEDTLRKNPEANAANKTAVLYVVAYLYEHREDADMDELTRSLRYMLSTEREAAF